MRIIKIAKYLSARLDPIEVRPKEILVKNLMGNEKSMHDPDLSFITKENYIDEDEKSGIETTHPSGAQQRLDLDSFRSISPA